MRQVTGAKFAGASRAAFGAARGADISLHDASARLGLRAATISFFCLDRSAHAAQADFKTLC
jgi:predicted NAD/FAD-binding protein